MKFENEKGQSMTIMPFILFVSLLLIGFSVDGGEVLFSKARINTIIEESLKSGSINLPDSNIETKKLVNEILALYDQTPSEYNIHIREDNLAMAITKNSVHNTYFWKLANVDKINYENEGLIILLPLEIDSLNWLIPIAFDLEVMSGYEAGIEYRIEINYETGPLRIINFAEEKLTTKELIEGGNEYYVNVGSVAKIKPGNSLGYFVNIYNRYYSDSVVLIPVVAWNENGYGSVEGFIKFEIANVIKKSGSLYIDGFFVGQTIDYSESAMIPPFFSYNRKIIKNINNLDRFWE